MTTLKLCKDELCEVCGAVRAALTWKECGDGGVDDFDANTIYAYKGAIVGPYWRNIAVKPTHYLRVPPPPKS